MSQSVQEQRLKEVEKAFALFDKNQDGKISKEELRSVIHEAKIPCSEEQVDQFFKMVDEDCNGSIDYDEFCKLTKTLVTVACDIETRMRVVFDGIDTDKDAKISAAELKKALSSLGQEVSENEAMEIVNTFDRNKDGHINFDEFITMMFVLEQCPI